jgi:hypothetical protein
MIVISKIQQFLGWAVLLAAVIGLVCLTVWSPTLAQPEPTLPARHMPNPTLPSRHPTPSAISEPHEEEKPVGAFIELRVSPAPPGVWTVVRWEDGLGGWHDVEGWQGTLDSADQKVWWVPQRDFGTGPFCWDLYAGQGGPSLGASDPFYLPGSANQRVKVHVSTGLETSTRARPEAGGGAGNGALPQTGGGRQVPASQLIALLLMLVSLLAILGTPWCVAQAKDS